MLEHTVFATEPEAPPRNKRRHRRQQDGETGTDSTADVTSDSRHATDYSHHHLPDEAPPPYTPTPQQPPPYSVDTPAEHVSQRARSSRDGARGRSSRQSRDQNTENERRVNAS